MCVVRLARQPKRQYFEAFDSYSNMIAGRDDQHTHRRDVDDTPNNSTHPRLNQSQSRPFNHPVKPIPKPPTWLPATLHIAHGLIAGGVGYMLSYAGVLYWHAEPHSKRGHSLLAAAILLAMFEISFFIYLALRKRKMRRAWADAAKYLKQDEFQAARISLLELLQYPEYKYSPAPVLFALGTVEQQLGHDRQAQILYRRCGDLPAAQKALGMILIENGLNHRASDVLRKLVSKHPNDAIATLLLANALFHDGKHAASERVIRNALERRPKSQLLRNNLERVQEGIPPVAEL